MGMPALSLALDSLWELSLVVLEVVILASTLGQSCCFRREEEMQEARSSDFLSLSCFLSWSKEEGSSYTLTAMLASTTKGRTHPPAAHWLAHLQGK